MLFWEKCLFGVMFLILGFDVHSQEPYRNFCYSIVKSRWKRLRAGSRSKEMGVEKYPSLQTLPSAPYEPTGIIILDNYCLSGCGCAHLEPWILRLETQTQF